MNRQRCKILCFTVLLAAMMLIPISALAATNIFSFNITLDPNKYNYPMAGGLTYRPDTDVLKPAVNNAGNNNGKFEFVSSVWRKADGKVVSGGNFPSDISNYYLCIYLKPTSGNEFMTDTYLYQNPDKLDNYRLNGLPAVDGFTDTSTGYFVVTFPYGPVENFRINKVEITIPLPEEGMSVYDAWSGSSASPSTLTGDIWYGDVDNYGTDEEGTTVLKNSYIFQAEPDNDVYSGNYWARLTNGGIFTPETAIYVNGEKVASPKTASTSITGRLVWRSLAHKNMQKVAAVAPTCHTEGNREYYYCDYCNRYFKDTDGEQETYLGYLTLPADETLHNFVEVIDAAATTTAPGKKHEECSVCGKKRNENTVIPQLTNPETEAPDSVNPGTDNSENDNSGNDNSENDNSGNDNSGNNNPGNDNPGNDNPSNDNPGNEITAPAVQPAAVGTILTDPATQVNYIVTDSAANEVKYAAPPSKQIVTAVIPDTVTINGTTYRVIGILRNAFKNCKKLKSVRIGNNSTVIGPNAFSGCTKLTKVTMSRNMDIIYAKAFYKCVSLKKITIPAGVTQIGARAFFGCKKLKTITIKTKELNKSKLGKKAFTGIHKNAKIRIPKATAAAYRKLLSSRGVPASAKVTAK